MYIFAGFSVEEEVANSVIMGIRETFLSFRSFLAYRARGTLAEPLALCPLTTELGFSFPSLSL